MPVAVHRGGGGPRHALGRPVREIMSQQGDLFHKDEQADLFAEDAPTPEYPRRSR
jgi:hypothetical protein